jgi:micrococcal nuclease
MRMPAVSAASVAALVLAVFLLLRSGGDDAAKRAGAGRADAGSDRVPVTRVIDGDTIEARLDGDTEDVRYIGVDTPETVKPGAPVECFGPEAHEFNERLVDGETVRLDYDAERRDVYGRLLAYVHVGDTFVNAELVRRGFATTLTIPPNDRYASEFARLEREASAAGVGLWGKC